ncbi:MULTISPECIES: CBS domain-containing protein [Ancylobacter]|uniref:Inosine-5-monophosphate dehydrogenase n=1 Tax=Ancylobacter defluvii TaxID=1282440 RepID=A0A9W6ND42_9HYPH|nr:MULTISPECIES: CBS domain-containing protein [Ancylobacter]MBS7587000.1 CBS domain-containing protein [Ancylobacter defluvii]MDR6951060.1 CBS domain-containing protein [Ancylobacter sp. 3268]GLK86305.1 inosine-5-monophosphate dehydrogenase [Ancylobacter defluvii]
MTVRSILDEKGYSVETIGPSASLREAAELMAQKRIGALVVTDRERRVIGILSERDVVRVIGLEGPERLDDELDTVMTTKVVTCDTNETVPQLMEQMTAGRFRHMPVVQGGKLIGLVSIGDVVKHRLAEFERESSAMREYILST